MPDPADRDAGPNHNPVWRLVDEYGNAHDVVACDELQARRYAERRWGAPIAAITLIAATLQAYRDTRAGD